MLKQRIVTALVLVILLLACLLHSNPVYWLLFINLVLLIGFWEWLRFCKISSVSQQALAISAYLAVLYFVQSGVLPQQTMIVAGCLLWAVLLAFTMTQVLEFLHNTAAKLTIGVTTLSIAGWLISDLKQLDNGVLWVVCFFVSVFAADIGAYFTGRRFGKTKLAPSISPGKTVEGMLGGLLLVQLIFVPIFFYYFSISVAFSLLVTVVVTAVVSVGGDLFESKMKRHVDMKDSSQILPGHGGVLDRIDSLVAGIPFFMLGLSLSGHITQA